MRISSPVDSAVTFRPSIVPVKETRPSPDSPMSQRKVKGRRHCGGMRAMSLGKPPRVFAVVSSNRSQLTI